MGLAEKRASQEFQDGFFSTWNNSIQSIVGKDIAIEVKWDQLAEDGYSHLYAEAWPKVYFEPIQNALKSICADKMGKDAINSSLKKIEIANEKSNSVADYCATFENGTLIIDHLPHTNIDEHHNREKFITKVLESKL